MTYELVTTTLTMALGSESTVHLAEESHRPETTVPRAMMASFVVGTIGAFAISVLLFYGITDVVAVLTTNTGSPVTEIVSISLNSTNIENLRVLQFRQATGSDPAAASIGLLACVIGIVTITLALTSTSRLT